MTARHPDIQVADSAVKSTYSRPIGSDLRERFETDGYVICDVLGEDEIAAFLYVMEDLLATDVQPQDNTVHNVAYQHFGDVHDFGRESRQYYFHLLTRPGTEPIHSAFYHPVVLDIVEQLLGPQPIVNNASILVFNPGVTYVQGWHLDVIQIPEDEIEDWLFSPERHHNSVQINLPLVDEQCLWVVPAATGGRTPTRRTPSSPAASTTPRSTSRCPARRRFSCAPVRPCSTTTT